MFISRADVLLRQLGASSPTRCCGTRGNWLEAWDTHVAEPWSTGVWPELKKIAIDYTVAEPALRGGAQILRRDLATSAGMTSATSRRSPGSIRGGLQSDLAILGENARVLADASRQCGHQPDRPHRSSGSPASLWSILGRFAGEERRPPTQQVRGPSVDALKLWGAATFWGRSFLQHFLTIAS
jgi:hypothetical protein